MSKQQFDNRQMQELLTLGNEGKLWAVEVRYNVPGDVKLYWRRNLTGEQCMKLRSRMFQFGFEIAVEPGHWQIICPMDIQEVHMYRQDRYLPDGAKLTTVKEDQPNG